MFPFLCVGASALFYALSFVVSVYVWWLAVLFPIPLWYAAAVSRLTWWHGLCWGGVFFGTHSAGLVHSLYIMASGPWYVRMMPGVIFVIYLTLYAIVLFGCIQLLQRNRWIHQSPVLRILVCAVGLWAMICLISRYCFTPCGMWQGYILINPLLPLAEYPSLLWPVYYLGVEGALFCLLLASAGITVVIITKNAFHVIIVGLIYFSWILGVLVQGAQVDRPEWLDNIAVLPCIYPMTTDGYAGAQSVCCDLQRIKRMCPTVDLVIMPEAALPAQIIDVLRKPGYCMVPDLILFTGGYQMVGAHYYNCMALFVDGQLRSCFAKRYPAPVTEYIPAWCPAIVRSFSFPHSFIINPSDNVRPCISCAAGITYVPYICSELFLSADPDDSYASIPIVACVNDSWCTTVHLRRCMHLCARLKAIAWQRDILYASFHTAVWINKNGTECVIAMG